MGIIIDDTTHSNTNDENKPQEVLTEQQVIACNNEAKLTPTTFYDEKYGFIAMRESTPPTTWEELSERYNQKSLRYWRKAKDQARRKLVELGSVEETNNYFKDFKLQKVMQVEAASVFRLREGTAVVVLQNPDEPRDISGFDDQIGNIIKRLSQSLRMIGITESPSALLILFNSQMSIYLSHQSAETNIVVVGTDGFKTGNLEPLEKHVIAHEAAHTLYAIHFKNNHNLSIAGGTGKVPFDQTFFHFFNEGCAEMAGLELNGISPKVLLRSMLPRIFPQAYQDLLNGRLEPIYTSAEISKWQVRYKRSMIEANIHQRTLPAAIMEYCGYLGITIDRLFEIQQEYMNVVKKKIASKYNIDVSLVDSDPFFTKRTLENLEIAFDPNDIDSMTDLGRLRPFDLIGKACATSSQEASQQFLTWLSN